MEVIAKDSFDTTLPTLELKILASEDEDVPNAVLLTAMGIRRMKVELGIVQISVR